MFDKDKLVVCYTKDNISLYTDRDTQCVPNPGDRISLLGSPDCPKDTVEYYVDAIYWHIALSPPVVSVILK